MRRGGYCHAIRVGISMNICQWIKAVVEFQCDAGFRLTLRGKSRFVEMIASLAGWGNIGKEGLGLPLHTGRSCWFHRRLCACDVKLMCRARMRVFLRRRKLQMTPGIIQVKINSHKAQGTLGHVRLSIKKPSGTDARNSSAM